MRSGKSFSLLPWTSTWTSSQASPPSFRHYLDEAGRYFDSHAMRAPSISLLAAKGGHPRVALVLARHSTITLTMDHSAHLDMPDEGAALEKPPGLPSGQGGKPHFRPGRVRPIAMPANKPRHPPATAPTIPQRKASLKQSAMAANPASPLEGPSAW
jgi:hypothetical protein